MLRRNHGGFDVAISLNWIIVKTLWLRFYDLSWLETERSRCLLKDAIRRLIYNGHHHIIDVEWVSYSKGKTFFLKFEPLSLSSSEKGE